MWVSFIYQVSLWEVMVKRMGSVGELSAGNMNPGSEFATCMIDPGRTGPFPIEESEGVQAMVCKSQMVRSSF